MALKEVDSFELFVNDKSGTQVLNFINGTLKDPSRKLFMQWWQKWYMAAQGFHCINHILPHWVRIYQLCTIRFASVDLLVDYYYSDNAKPGLKKLRFRRKRSKQNLKI